MRSAYVEGIPVCQKLRLHATLNTLSDILFYFWCFFNVSMKQCFYAHISGYEDRSSTYLLFMRSLRGAANQRKAGLKRWTESKSSLFQTEEELRGCGKAMYKLTKCYLKLTEVHSETKIFQMCKERQQEAFDHLTIASKSHESCWSSFKRESHNLAIHLKCLQALIWVR